MTPLPPPPLSSLAFACAGHCCCSRRRWLRLRPPRPPERGRTYMIAVVHVTCMQHSHAQPATSDCVRQCRTSAGVSSASSCPLPVGGHTHHSQSHQSTPSQAPVHLCTSYTSLYLSRRSLVKPRLASTWRGPTSRPRPGAHAYARTVLAACMQPCIHAPSQCVPSVWWQTHKGASVLAHHWME